MMAQIKKKNVSNVNEMQKIRSMSQTAKFLFFEVFA